MSDDDRRTHDPLTEKGQKILRSMEGTYGSEEKAKQVLFASKNAGKITGIDEQPDPGPAVTAGPIKSVADLNRMYRDRFRPK